MGRELFPVGLRSSPAQSRGAVKVWVVSGPSQDTHQSLTHSHLWIVGGNQSVCPDFPAAHIKKGPLQLSTVLSQKQRLCRKPSVTDF